MIFAVTVSSITSPACTSMHCSEHAHWMSTQSPEVAGDVITADLCLGNENWPWHCHKCEYDLCDQCIGANPGKKTGDKRDLVKPR